MGTYFRNVEQYLDQIDKGDWIEIGVDRGEGSTPWIAEQAKKRNVDFFAVDVDPVQISTARQNFVKNQTMSPRIFLVESKGESFLRDYARDHPDRKVSFAYLDNFDWNYWLGEQEEDFVPKVKQHYKDLMGVEMSNINSQITHMLQAMLLLNLMTANSIIMCDDTWFHPREGVFIGKCSSAIPFLLMSGYRVLHSEGYRQNSGVILGKFENEKNSTVLG